MLRCTQDWESPPYRGSFPVRKTCFSIAYKLSYQLCPSFISKNHNQYHHILVNLISCKLYLNKAVFKKDKKEKKSLVMVFRTHNPKIWHFGILTYFRLKGFWEMVCARRTSWPSTSDLPVSDLKQVMRPSCEKYPNHTWRWGASLSPKTEGHRKEPERIGLAKFPLVYTYLIFFALSYLSLTFYSSSNLI